MDASGFYTRAMCGGSIIFIFGALKINDLKIQDQPTYELFYVNGLFGPVVAGSIQVPVQDSNTAALIPVRT
jgi:hypothetical protein